MANGSGMNGFGAIGEFAIGEADEGGITASTTPPFTYDYPNPRGYLRSVDLLTWAWSSPIRQTDVFYGLGGPSFDWPNPRGYIPAIALRTWIQSTPLNLIGQDIFYGLGGPSIDWPNPRGPQFPISLRTYVQPTNLVALRPPPFYGLAGNPNFDWPNPRGPQRSIDALLLTNNSPFILLGLQIPSLAFSSDMAAYTCSANDSASGQDWSGAGYMAIYDIDTSIQFYGVFRNSLTGVYIDPTTVTIYMLDPTGTETSYDNLTGSVVRDSLGHYHFTLTPTISGVWTYKWRGIGNAVATSPDTSFTINASSLIAG